MSPAESRNATNAFTFPAIACTACAAAIEDPDFIEFMNNAGQTISYMDAEAYTAYLKQAAEDVPKAMEAVGLL